MWRTGKSASRDTLPQGLGAEIKGTRVVTFLFETSSTPTSKGYNTCFYRDYGVDVVTFTGCSLNVRTYSMILLNSPSVLWCFQHLKKVTFAGQAPMGVYGLN